MLHMQRDDMEAIPGYLSLHQTAELMTLKWTPNQLMNGNVGELDSEKRLAQKKKKNAACRGQRGPEFCPNTVCLIFPSASTGITL